MAGTDYQELIGRISKGEEAAFRAFYFSLYPRLVAAARQISNDAVIAEEVVQDVFVWVWNKRDQLHKIDKIDDYLYRSVYRNMGQAIQRERKRVAKLNEGLVSRETVVADNAIDTIIKEEEDHRRQATVAYALELLSPQQRQIIHLRFMERKTYREISGLLEIGEQVARNTAYRGLKKLRLRMGGAWNLLRLCWPLLAGLNLL